MSATALSILDSLESRLRRVEFLVHGGDAQWHDQDQGEGSLHTRLERLQKKMDDLSHRSQPAATLFDLSNRLPEVVKATTNNISDHENLQTSTAYKTSMIMSSAEQFPTMVTQLTSIKDLNVPDGDGLAILISQQRRVEAIQKVQDRQEMAERYLRDRSAALTEDFIERVLLGHGQDWESIEDAMRNLERTLRRIEHTRRGEGPADDS